MCYDKVANAKVAIIDLEHFAENPQIRWKSLNQNISHISWVADNQLGYKENMAGLFLYQENKKNKKKNIMVQFGMFNKKRLDIEDKDMGQKYKDGYMKDDKIAMVNEEHNSQSGHTRWDFDFFMIHPTNKRLI